MKRPPHAGKPMAQRLATTGVLRAAPGSGLNLGGLGCGGIELWPDGIFRHPQFLNNRPWAGRTRGHNYQTDVGYAPPEPAFGPEDLFFILRTQRRGEAPQLRFLMLGAGNAFGQEMSRTYKYAVCPTVQGIEHRAQFPFIHLRYLDDRLPVALSLCAWTALVPHHSSDSSLPGAVFDFTAHNRSATAVDVAIFCGMSNLAGFDSADFRHRHVRLKTAEGEIIRMAGGSDTKHPTSGEMSLFARRHTGQRLTAIEANPYLENLFHTIYASGDLEGPLEPRHIARVEYLAHPETEPYFRDKGWICLGQRLPARTAGSFRMGMSWFFPNHVDRLGHRVGKFYETRFGDSSQVARHLLSQGDELKQRSEVFPHAVLSSTMERRFALSLLDQLSTLTKSSWYSRDGHFFLWEGLGCCGLNTVDVDHYASFALLTLFPDLRRDVLDHVAEGQLEDGRIPHSFNQVCEVEKDNQREYRRWDVNAQYLVGLFRDWRWTGDRALLQRHYGPALMAYRLLRSMDRYGVGLPYIEGGITYDHWRMKGIVTYMAGIYLAACQAMEHLARACDDAPTARDAAMALQEGRRSFETLLWNGGRYALFYRRHYAHENPQERAIDAGELAGDSGDFQPGKCDCENGCCAKKTMVNVEANEGLQTDALNGEAYARLVGLPRTLQRTRVRATLRQVLKRSNHRDLGFLANGSYEDGRYPDHWPFSQWQNPWTGTEYFFAAHLFLEGYEKEGLELIGNVFDRLDAAGMRFNHVECNTHYARPLSIYAAYTAWLGLDHDVPGQCLHLHPLLKARQIRAPFLTPLLLGTLELNRQPGRLILRLRIHEGKSLLRRIDLGKLTPKTAAIRLNGRTLPLAESRTSRTSLTLAKPVELTAGATLAISARTAAAYR